MVGRILSAMKALIPSCNMHRFFRFHFIWLLVVHFASSADVAVSFEKNSIDSWANLAYCSIIMDIEECTLGEDRVEDQER